MKYLFLALAALIATPSLANPVEDPRGAVVHPVFFTVDFKVEGYTLVGANKSAERTQTPLFMYMESSINPTITKTLQVAPEDMLTKLAKLIDDKVDAKKNAKTTDGVVPALVKPPVGTP
tara:strand:- start:55 stop:411 length:357 start_codon:yes stop_codon:yes gene_type:complete